MKPENAGTNPSCNSKAIAKPRHLEMIHPCSEQNLTHLGCKSALILTDCAFFSTKVLAYKGLFLSSTVQLLKHSIQPLKTEMWIWVVGVMTEVHNDKLGSGQGGSFPLFLVVTFDFFQVIF